MISCDDGAAGGEANPPALSDNPPFRVNESVAAGSRNLQRLGRTSRSPQGLSVTHLPKAALPQHPVLPERVLRHWLPGRTGNKKEDARHLMHSCDLFLSERTFEKQNR